MSRIGKILPKPIKNFLLKLWHAPSRIHARFFMAAMSGALPCPDKLFLKWNFRVFMKRKLDLKNPKTFNEKLQWLKYYYRNEKDVPLADKYAVRAYVAELLSEDVLIPCYGVFDNWNEIDFNALPDSFVIKCTHDSGSVALCHSKSTFDFDAARKKIEAGLARNQFYLSREWVYKHIKPRIIIEALLKDDAQPYIRDYKCMCFNGEMKCCYVCSDRGAESGTRLDFYDMNWERMNVRHVFPNADAPIARPALFDKMVEYANKVAQGRPFVRVDFYEVNGKLYFGEITFFPSGGRMPYEPESFDRLMGDWITLPAPIKNK